MSLLRNSKFIIFNARLSATNFGYTLYMITVPAYSYVLTNSILFTGLTLFVEYGIYSVTFWAGPLTDRMRDKRFIIMISEAGIGACSLLLGWLTLIGNIDRYTFLLLIGVIAFFWDIIWTADHSVLPLIVSEPELPKANGITSAVGNGHVAAGLVVGGFLFAFIGDYGSLILYGFSMFLAAILTIFVPLIVPEEERKLDPSFMSGWSYVLKKNRNLLYFSIVIAFFSLFSNIPVLAMSGIYAKDLPVWYSISFSTFYIGAMLSGFAVGSYFPYRFIGRLLLLTYLATGVITLVAAFLISSPLADLLPWFALGFFFSVHTTVNSVYLQKVTVKEMLGRTASNLYTFRGITTAAGSVAFPIWMSVHGIVTVMKLSGLIIAGAALLIYAFSPGMRKLKILEAAFQDKDSALDPS